MKSLKSKGFILLGARMCLKHFMAISQNMKYPVWKVMWHIVLTFCAKVDLMERLKWKHDKFCENHAIHCRDTLWGTLSPTPWPNGGAKQKVWGSPTSPWFILWEPGAFMLMFDPQGRCWGFFLWTSVGGTTQPQNKNKRKHHRLKKTANVYFFSPVT